MLNPRARTAESSRPATILSGCRVAAFSCVELAIETGSLSGMAGHAVAERRHFHQHRIVVAIHEDPSDLKPVARRPPPWSTACRECG